MEFILGEKEKGCIFCNRVQRQNDREDLILSRGKESFVLLNKYPYNNGHIMIVPNKHTDDMGQLGSDTLAELLTSIDQWSKVMKSALKAQGFNIGLNLGDAAGAGVRDHLHFHLVPRWIGDTNFMPVLSDTRVMPEALEKTYDSLKKAWEAR
jgi:ATP adenylyltransferase